MEQARRIKGVGLEAVMSKINNSYTILIGKSEGKDFLRRSRSSWESEIIMNLKAIGWEESGLDSRGSGYRPVAGSTEHGNEDVVHIGWRI
jgi:hypothetical protein